MFIVLVQILSHLFYVHLEEQGNISTRQGKQSEMSTFIPCGKYIHNSKWESFGYKNSDE
jgi:hypothetical protein